MVGNATQWFDVAVAGPEVARVSPPGAPWPAAGPDPRLPHQQTGDRHREFTLPMLAGVLFVRRLRNRRNHPNQAHPPIDRGKSPLLDADHDVVRIADALRGSPHILGADAEPGDDTVRFTSAAGISYTLTLEDAEPTDDDLLPEPVLTEALAAAILNALHFVIATPDSPHEDTITVHTRSGVRHLLVLGVGRTGPDHDRQPSTPAADVAYAADRLIVSDPSDAERATVELLNYVAATGDKQDLPLRQHDQAVARALTR
ncbi:MULTISPECIES: hypothetical protein [Streptomyces]|uniref:hypothetical protein n=1 Tax=Streptomyces TaxID=1883 RepID=UPI001C0F13E8|nr:hypothetical protein [Streptomyces kasugaensis]